MFICTLHSSLDLPEMQDKSKIEINALGPFWRFLFGTLQRVLRLHIWDVSVERGSERIV